ncbi:MAG: nucleotide sugar dehydrogenase [Actinomycetota bacterium]|nr:nucleotide sugar dehydrogenase [Actinomycetota bacterium]
MRIAIIGQGYVGYALSLAATKAGHSVIGLDVNPKLISEIKAKGELKNYLPTNNEADIKDQDAYIIAVPTPLDEKNLPDLSSLITAAQLIARSASKGALVINESTSYPGTLREIVITEIEKSNKAKFLYAAAPERIDPANTKWSIKNTPRVVAGIDDQSSKAAYEFYKSICDEVIVVSSPEVAEAAKLFENTFRQVNIALVNELAQVTEKLGISANEVIKAAATKPFGFMKFNPSLGVGGHCIPIDPIYLAQKAESVGASAQFIRQANLVNQQMPLYVLKRLEGLLNGNMSSKKICIVGISYKADVEDMRQSPSIVLWQELEKKGALVSFHDEVVKEFEGKKSMTLSLNSFDLAVVAVTHSNLEVDKVINSAPIIFDCTGTIKGAYQL